MANKRKIGGTYFDVLHMDGNGGLCTHNNEDFDKTVDEINRICESAKAQGWKNDDKYMIVMVEWTKKYDGLGNFVFSETTKTAFATYDNGIVTKI